MLLGFTFNKVKPNTYIKYMVENDSIHKHFFFFEVYIIVNSSEKLGRHSIRALSVPRHDDDAFWTMQSLSKTGHSNKPGEQQLSGLLCLHALNKKKACLTTATDTAVTYHF